MRLDFNVLWIDDQPDPVKGFQDNLELVARKEGFNLQVTFAISFEVASDHIQDHVFMDDVDMVVVDYDLGAGEKGDSAVKEIRKLVPYKDIVLYSAVAAGDLKRLVFEKGVEGVYCTSRVNLGETLQGVFEALVKKVLDIDNCRGIVMAVTSDIDQIVSECLSSIEPKLGAAHASQAIKYASEKIGDRINRLNRIQSQIESSPSLAELLEVHELFTATDRLKLLKTIIGLHFNGEHKDLEKAIGRYVNDIPQKRNRLGHVRLVAEGALRTLRGRNAETVSYGELTSLRQLLITYRDQFERVASLFVD